MKIHSCEISKIPIQFKSFHRPPLYRPNFNSISYRDTRAKCKIFIFSCFDRMPLVSKVPCNTGFYVEICTTLTAAARAVPDLSFPFPSIFFSGHSIGPSVSSHLCPPLYVVMAKWLWIPLVYDRMKLVRLSRRSRLPIRFRPQKRSDSLEALKLEFQPRWRLTLTKWISEQFVIRLLK